MERGGEGMGLLCLISKGLGISSYYDLIGIYYYRHRSYKLLTNRPSFAKGKTFKTS